MIDRREQILSRLVDVLTNMAGATIDSSWNVYRNKEDLTEAMQPAFVVFDAHEERGSIGESVNIQTGLRSRIRMAPRIGLYCADLPENVGPILNGMRVAALAAIFSDAANYADPAALGSILTTNGAAFYEGLGCALDRGSEMTGEMILNISFYYWIFPQDLT